MFKRIPGTKDILPNEAAAWQKMEDTARNIFSLYNYRQIRLPLIEDASLFNRSLGESTEVVQKQMFLIRKEKDCYALRPEGTASVVRAYLENSLDRTEGFVKLYYTGAMFRMERPQKGRLRQFHHIGCEAIGSEAAQVDVEIIALADDLLKAFSVTGYEIRLNSLGCPKDKKGLVEKLRRYLKDKNDKLCQDCQERLKINVLRVLDCKNPACKETVAGLDIEDDRLCLECKEHFSIVKDGLELLGIAYKLSPHLVRGLDYYTRTVFEATHPDLGSQDALGAGGRYDNLVEELGGPRLGSCGFALGAERVLLASSLKPEAENTDLIYAIALTEEARKLTLRLLDDMRKAGIRCDSDYSGKSLKGMMRSANNAGARYVLIIGEDELKRSGVTLKDMSSGEQKELRTEDLPSELMRNVKIQNPK
ncbi:MAG: histidine--tRNA ligase [Candidatus Omnitrophica bacterium]|nr:histidine--tRNA ligase [Candidatus Omnitrophota bacterium]